MQAFLDFWNFYTTSFWTFIGVSVGVVALGNGLGQIIKSTARGLALILMASLHGEWPEGE